MRDSAGRFVAEPLRKGGAFCMMHTLLFSRTPAESGGSIVVYIDLETNSLDVLSGKIVEIGALVDGSRNMFSTVVHPGHDASLDDASVHGIPHQELLSGPCFAEAFGRLEHFLRYASLSVLESDDDSEDDRLPAVGMQQNLDVALVAHNGAKFDFPFLLSECLRVGLGPAAMSSWIYVDTLDVLSATDRAGECKKLQCALRACCGSANLRAHRALDDCIALGAVVRHVSASLGIKPWALLRPFAYRLDETATIAQMSALLA
jgi:DNA polymerase III epsilon subunit-like protein